ncbi:MAG: hypothetical protein A2062_03180 [Omnitrophica WOR_2 bacterium GWA2_44_7]|nr:MAG: hypothetical protein A2062_03180 [Omnitrophica WOR_2 bacterium GWA2_44_7]
MKNRYMPFLTKFKWILFSLFFVYICVANLSNEFLDLGGDSAQYIILAESLSQGLGYRAINYPQEPFSYHYPPVFPLLLSPIIYFFGRNFYLIRLLTALLGYGSLFFIYQLLKKYTEKKEAFLVTLVFATNFIFLSYSIKYILSDIPYLFVSCAALLFSAQYVKAKAIGKTSIAVLMGLWLSYFTRYAGITLFFGIVTLLLLHPKQNYKKIYFISIGFLTPLLLWIIAGRMLNPSYAYSKYFFLIDPYRPFLGTILGHPLQIVTRLTQGINYYCSLIGDSLFFYLHNSDRLKSLLSLFSFAMVFLGLWRSFRKNKLCVFHYYFLFYFLMVSLWPFQEGARFILPILPFIYYYFFEAAKGIFTVFYKKPLPLGFYSFFLILNLLFLPAKENTLKNLPLPLANFLSLHTWAKAHLPGEGIIISRKPTVTYFFTGHQALCYPFSLDPEEIWQDITIHNAKYLLVDEFSRETYVYLSPFLSRYKDKLTLLKRVGSSGVFEIHP